MAFGKGRRQIHIVRKEIDGAFENLLATLGHIFQQCVIEQALPFTVQCRKQGLELMQDVTQERVGKSVAHLVFQIVGSGFEVTAVFNRTFPRLFLYLAKLRELLVGSLQFVLFVGEVVKHFLQVEVEFAYLLTQFFRVATACFQVLGKSFHFGNHLLLFLL